MFPRTNRKALQYALLTLSTRGPGYHRESAVILCVSYNNFVPRNVARGLLSATVGQPERTNKSVIPPCSTRADSISLFLYLSLSLFPSLLLSLSALTNSRIWKNCNSIFRRGLGRCACIIVFLSLSGIFLFFRRLVCNELMNHFWENLSSPRGSPATIGQYEWQYSGVIFVFHTRVSAYLPPLPLCSVYANS